jgi:hypothetical protein
VNSAATRVEKAVDFLISSQFDSQLNLCREAPMAAPNHYWLVSDNLWAFKALKMANESRLANAVEAGRVANLIEAKLKEKTNTYNLPADPNRFPISFMHEAVIGDSIPTPNRTCNQIILQSNDCTVGTEIYNGTIMQDWQKYADRLLFMALSFHWQENDTAANDYFELAEAMWDGMGINDTATNANGSYASYKLALLLYASKVLGIRLAFEFELVMRIWSLQRETDGGIMTNYFANGTSSSDANTETTSIVIIAILTAQRPSMGTLAFYYPWYGNSSHWPPNGNITDNPLSGFYDSNNETLIKEHIDMAKEAGIDGFIVSWWGINSFEDNATLHIKNVCEQNNFTFTIYYEITSSVGQTINDLEYVLNNYANSSAWFRIDGRPVIYVYVRARDNLNPQAWNWHACLDSIGNDTDPNKIENAAMQWLLSEEVRKPARYGIIPIQPFQNTPGYIVNVNPIHLQPDEQYWLNVGVSDIRNDSLIWSDVGVKIKIGLDPTCNDTLYDQIVNFTNGWIDSSFPINMTRYSGKDVYIRAESYNGGLVNWSSEWAAVDYLFINDSKGEIVNPDPFFDNGWKNVVEELRKRDFNPYFIMDFSGYQYKIQDFADYFLEFADGIHCYNPVTDISKNLSVVFHIYNQASEAAHSKNKTFVATIMPGYNDTKNVVDRQNGTYYALFWSIAKACSADGYAITSFNEWHEGTEIEPSIEYGYQYIDLTRVLQTMWTAPFNIEVVGNSALSDFHINVIQKIVCFNVSGLKDTEGFCNVTIPNIIVQDLWEGNLTVLIDGEPLQFINWTDTTNTYIYINYTHTEHQITLIPEIPSLLILPIFMAATLLIIVPTRKSLKRLEKPPLIVKSEH